jgi:hypothetical protein
LLVSRKALKIPTTYHSAGLNARDLPFFGRDRPKEEIRVPPNARVNDQRKQQKISAIKKGSTPTINSYW